MTSGGRPESKLREGSLRQGSVFPITQGGGRRVLYKTLVATETEHHEKSFLVFTNKALTNRWYDLVFTVLPCLHR